MYIAGSVVEVKVYGALQEGLGLVTLRGQSREHRDVLRATRSLSIAMQLRHIPSMLALSVASILGLASYVSAHGGSGHEQIVVAPDADWATRHMAGQ